jgi:hypothetical protein
MIDKLAAGLRRALTAEPAEWWVRGRQTIFAGRTWLRSRLGSEARPRHGHLHSLRLTAADLPAWWRTRGTAKWFLNDAHASRLRRWHSRDDTFACVLQRADTILDGQMPLLDWPPVDFSSDDRWWRDPILQKVAPDRFYARVAYLDAEQVGDSKYVWEPNRFAWSLWLGLAHQLTADQRYADSFAELTRDWFVKNPYPRGVNYCSALEIALRAYAWVWAADLFAARLSTDADLLSQLLAGIWTSCRHIEENLSHYFSPNTHLIGEAFGLYACGSALPEFRESERWRRVGTKILKEQARCQFFADGTHRELSSGYHLYATDFYLHACLIARQTGFDLDPAIWRTARRLATRLAALVPPDGILPQFNDCDGGRLMWACAHPLDAAPSLAAAESLFPEAYLPAGRAPAGYSLLMADGDRRCQRGTVAMSGLPAKHGETAPDSGLVPYCNASGDYLLFRATPFGFADCPHSHDAPLSVIVYLQGHPIFVDSGVGSYTQDIGTRNQFRRAPGKNVLLVDGDGPSVPGGWFSWQRTTDATLIRAGDCPGGFHCRGQHAGFTKPPDRQVLVTREVTVLDEGIVGVVDRWESNRELPIRVVFTLAPGLTATPERGELRLASGETFHFLVASLEKPEPPLPVAVLRIPYSPAYGKVDFTQAIDCQPGSSARGSCVTLLSRVGPVLPTPRAGRFRLAGQVKGVLCVTSQGLGLRQHAVPDDV